MASKEIIIEATPEGAVTISVKGVKGQACKDLTAAFEKALGKVVKVEKTKEWNEKPVKALHSVRQS